MKDEDRAKPRKRRLIVLGCLGAILGLAIAAFIGLVIYPSYYHRANSADEELWVAYLNVFVIWPAGLFLGAILGVLSSFLGRREGTSRRTKGDTA